MPIKNLKCLFLFLEFIDDSCNKNGVDYNPRTDSEIQSCPGFSSMCKGIYISKFVD